MGEKFFETGFQFEKYINERLLEISDDGEKRILKELLRETLIPFYQHTEEAYHELERKLIDREQHYYNRYEIMTGVERRDKIDVTEDAMVPMQKTDRNEFVLDSKEMQKCIRQGMIYKMMKVFLAVDYSEICMLERDKRTFQGVVRTEDGEYPAKFLLKKNTDYLKQIANLYSVFEENGVEWNTVCAPYLGKFFDVYIKETECPESEEIVEVTINFEEYKNKIIYDLIPMWNVRIFEESTSSYPDLAFDRIHYEHCIFKSRIKDSCDYLVYAEDKKIWEVIRRNGDLHIICDEEEPMRWKLIEIGYEAKQRRYNMPVFGNYQNGKQNGRCIHTLAQVRKYISELGYEEQLQLIEIKQNEMISKEQRMTYSMDDFLEDEIRVSSNRPIILFVFRAADKENFLNKDLMSYLISRIQWKLPEFECIGELE